MRRGDTPLRSVGRPGPCGAGPDRSALLPAMRRQRGFSLLELVITLSIIAIAAAVAIPRYGRALARYRAEMGARRIIADLDRARQRARATSAGCTVEFDATGYLVEPDVVTSAADVYRVDLSRDPYRARIFNINFNGDAIVAFNGYGVPDSGGSLVVRAGTGAFVITLDPQAGKPRYQRYTGVLPAEMGG